MPSVTSFNEALELARRLFSAATSEEEARTLAVELRVSGKLGLSVLRNYIGQAAYITDERAQTVSTLLEGMSNDGLDMVPLLPVFLPLLTSPDHTLRETVTDIICRLAEDSAIAENMALGCLRNPDPEIRQCGAKILNAIAPWCGGALKSKLGEMMALVEGESPAEGLLKTAILRCRGYGASTLQRPGPPAPAAPGAPVEEYDPAKSVNGRVPFSTPDLKGRRVFFADDDPQIRSLVGKLLINAGATLQMASNGEEAIQMINQLVTEKCPPDLAILDLRMPGENGMRVLEHLRKVFGPRQPQVILLTAVKDQQIIHTAMHKYGIHSYLIKPVPLGEFYARIATALNIPLAP